MKKILFLVPIVLLLYGCGIATIHHLQKTLRYEPTYSQPLTWLGEAQMIKTIKYLKDKTSDLYKQSAYGDVNVEDGTARWDDKGVTWFMKKSALIRDGENTYKKSPTGKAYFGGGYFYWNDEGLTIFMEKDFVTTE